MFKNIKVGTKLIAGFLMVSILAAILGAIGLRNMSVINDKASEMYQMELLGISYVKEANINLVYIGRALSNALLASTPEERKRFADRIESSRQAFKLNIQKSRPMFYSEDGKQLMASLDEKFVEYE